MYLVTAYCKDRSTSVALHTAQEVIITSDKFRAEGFEIVVLDDRGREVSCDQLNSEALQELQTAALKSIRT